MSVLSVCTFGPLLIGVERAGGMRPRTHLDVIVWRAARHRGQFVMMVGIIHRLRVRRIVRSVADRMAIGLWVTRIRINFVASEDYGAFIKDEDATQRWEEIKTNRRE